MSLVDTAAPAAPSERVERSLLRLCAATFLAFLTVALPLPVIPLHVHRILGYGDLVVGCVVGVQFLATLLTRGVAGRYADTAGARSAMLRGILIAALAGLAYVCSAWLPSFALGVLVFGRVLLGIGESLLVTGMLAWGIGLLGPARSGKVMTWTGIALYGAFAAGAPLGLALDAHGGFALVGATATVLCLAAFALAFGVRATPLFAAQRPPLREVVGRIVGPALALALQGVGFATIGAFVSLHFAARGWSGAGFALTAFGAAFVAVRVFCGRAPDRYGGARVAAFAMGVEACGLGMLWLADSAPMAWLGAAITGAGCSLVFPGLGVEVVRRVPAHVRATALGFYAAAQDLAYALTGPLAGLLAARYGYASAFVFGTFAAVIGALIAMRLAKK